MEDQKIDRLIDALQGMFVEVRTRPSEQTGTHDEQRAAQIAERRGLRAARRDALRNALRDF